MKNLITSSATRTFAIIFAGVLFSVSIFATPASANIFDDLTDCFPLPVCSDSPIVECFPLPICPPSSHSNRDYYNYDYEYRYDDYREPTVGRRTYAEPAAAPAPAPVVTNTNTNTNTNTIYVNGGGSASSYPVYVEVPSYPSYPTYYPTYPQYPQYQPVAPVNVTCSANTLYAGLGNEVVWQAFATGGNGYYTYSWSGTDGVYGQGYLARKSYSYPGQKNAFVTVYSNGARATAYCAPITVGGPVYQPAPVYPQPVPQYPQAPTLDIACYATPTKTRVGQAVTWTAEVRGGYGPYNITWSGTSGLSGTGPSVTKYYTTAGTKKATITATSANGITSTRNCGVSVSVAAKPGTAVQTPVNQNPTVPTVTPESQTSSAFFSLANVPWGWVAFLVILVLFVTVIYLLFNRLKI